MESQIYNLSKNSNKKAKKIFFNFLPGNLGIKKGNLVISG